MKKTNEIKLDRASDVFDEISNNATKCKNLLAVYSNLLDTGNGDWECAKSLIDVALDLAYEIEQTSIKAEETYL